MLLTVILFHHGVDVPPSNSHTDKPRPAGWVPWAATLLVRSRLLEGPGGPYFGSVHCCDPLLTPATIDTVVRIFGYDWRIFSIFLGYRATLDFVGFCVLASPGDRF